MGRVIAIASGKGGTGKSFFTVNLGAMLAEKGEKVLLIDADTGALTLDSYLDLQNERKGDFLDVILQEAALEDVIIQDKNYTSLYLLPGSVTGDNLLFDENDMKNFCEYLKEKFDYVLLDCPAGSNPNARNVIWGADELIMVVLSMVGSVRNADILITRLMKDGFFDISFVLNRVNDRLVEAGDMLAEDDVIEILEIPLLGSLPEDERVLISINEGEVFVKEYRNSVMADKIRIISERVVCGLFYKFIVR